MRNACELHLVVFGARHPDKFMIFQKWNRQPVHTHSRLRNEWRIHRVPPEERQREGNRKLCVVALSAPFPSIYEIKFAILIYFRSALRNLPTWANQFCSGRVHRWAITADHGNWKCIHDENDDISAELAKMFRSFKKSAPVSWGIIF